jgi:hypothetical protein
VGRVCKIIQSGRYGADCRATSQAGTPRSGPATSAGGGVLLFHYQACWVSSGVDYLSLGRKMLVFSRQAGRATTDRAGPAGGDGQSTEVTWWLLLSSSDLL